MILELEMPITDEIRCQLQAALEKDRSLKLLHIANETGVSWQTLSRFLEGKTLMSHHLDKIADYLKIGVTTPPTPPKKSAPKKSPKK